MVVIGLAKLKALEKEMSTMGIVVILASDSLVKNSCNDSEEGHGEDSHQYSFALHWKTCNGEHAERNGNQEDIGRNVENHLNIGIVCVGGTLLILNRNSPVLLERSAEEPIVTDLNDHVANPYVND